MAEFKTNVMRILDREGIEYTAHEYPHGKEAVDGVSVAKLLGQNPEYVFKTLVTKGSKDYFVFVVPVADELDLKKCAKSVGEKSVEMIHVKDITKVTGYVRGGCSPIGMKKSLKTVLHETARDFDSIIFSAGKIGYQVQMNAKDLEKIIRLSYGDLIVS